MATISSRIDGNTKAQAEEIANSIGLNLSSVINVFINRFVAERGFPFAVSDPKTIQMFDRVELSDTVSRAIKERKEVPEVPESFYLIPGTDNSK